MWLMLQQENPDNYVLATGKQYTIRQFIEKAFNYVGKTIVLEGTGIDEIGKDKNTGKVYVRVNPRYFRPNEVSNLLGDASKAKRILKWCHKYDIDLLIKDMIDNDL
jgi:GDPmannose 4,6-dehydratase